MRINYNSLDGQQQSIIKIIIINEQAALTQNEQFFVCSSQLTIRLKTTNIGAYLWMMNQNRYIIFSAMDPLWVDKYRPKSLEKLTYHPQITEVLTQLAQTNDFPHLIFYGPDGSGKKTRAYAFLAKLFGDHVFKLKEQQRILKPENTSTTIEYSIFTSNYHIEMTPADNEHNDRHIIQNVVKQIAANTNIEAKSGRGFKVLVINEADKLTKDAQGGLRRTMEKYMKNCRMILLCNSVHKLIHPIRSRCLNIRVPAPNETAIAEVLAEVGKIQSSSNSHVNFSFSQDMYNRVANTCDRNLRLALIQLQSSRYTKSNEGMLAPHKREIKQIKEMIFKEQSPPQLKRIRDKFYDLLVNCIDGQTILKQLLQNIINGDDLRQEMIKQVVHQAAEHEKTLLCGSKAIYHLESFAAHVMEQVLLSKHQKMTIE